jgi:murein DD-endopeptidase MepM/ murein hydrolase activator NlpD
MKLRTKDLPSAYSASYGYVRNWNGKSKEYTRFHQGWDLEAADGTLCYAIKDGTITHCGTHKDFGKNIVLKFLCDRPEKGETLFAFYAHLSKILVSIGDGVSAGDIIGRTGHTGIATASAPHLHFEIRNVPQASPGKGKTGRINPGEVLGYGYLVCEPSSVSIRAKRSSREPSAL